MRFKRSKNGPLLLLTKKTINLISGAKVLVIYPWAPPPTHPPAPSRGKLDNLYKYPGDTISLSC